MTERFDQHLLYSLCPMGNLWTYGYKYISFMSRKGYKATNTFILGKCVLTKPHAKAFRIIVPYEATSIETKKNIMKFKELGPLADFRFAAHHQPSYIMSASKDVLQKMANEFIEQQFTINTVLEILEENNG